MAFGQVIPTEFASGTSVRLKLEDEYVTPI
jgi:hypothetical protein